MPNDWSWSQWFFFFFTHNAHLQVVVQITTWAFLKECKPMMASLAAALQVQVDKAGGLQAGTAFSDLLSAMEALSEAFLAGKSWVFITELHHVTCYTCGSIPARSCLVVKVTRTWTCPLSAALWLSTDIPFSFSGACVRTTAAPASRGVCIMSDNVLAGWSVLTE